MIWSEELSASLNQTAGVVVFHRIELTRSQQLAQTLADKLNTLVEQNEKALDQKLGNTTNWNERGDGAKGEKRGEQTSERRRRGDGRGGARGKCHFTVYTIRHSQLLSGGTRGGRGARFAQGLGNQMTQRGR